MFWGGIGPKMHSSGTGPVTFFRGAILDWGAQAVIWGGTAPKCPPVEPGLDIMLQV